MSPGVYRMGRLSCNSQVEPGGALLGFFFLPPHGGGERQELIFDCCTTYTCGLDTSTFWIGSLCENTVKLHCLSRIPAVGRLVTRQTQL